MFTQKTTNATTEGASQAAPFSFSEPAVKQEAQHLVKEYTQTFITTGFYGANQRAINSSEPPVRFAVLLALLETTNRPLVLPYSYPACSRFYRLASVLLQTDFPLDAPAAETLLRVVTANREHGWVNEWFEVLEKVVSQVVRHYEKHPVCAAACELLTTLSANLTDYDYRIVKQHGCRTALAALLSRFDESLPVADGTEWSRIALDDLAELTPEGQKAWNQLFAHVITTGDHQETRPGGRQGIQQHVKAVGGRKRAAHYLTRWLQSVDTSPIAEEMGGVMLFHHQKTHRQNDFLLPRLLRYLVLASDTPETASLLADLAQKTYPGRQGLPREGWHETLGDAALCALSLMNCLAAAQQLKQFSCLLPRKTKRQEAEENFKRLATRQNKTPNALEDEIIPRFGLDEKGTRRETVGDCVAVIAVSADCQVTLRWHNAAGHLLKSPPVRLRENGMDARKIVQLQNDVKSITKQAAEQQGRLHGFLCTERTWHFAAWRDCLTAHPLVAPLLKRLIWRINDASGSFVLALWEQGRNTISGEARGRFMNADGQKVEGLTEKTVLQLWHPVTSDAETTERWRGVLQAENIVQPFEQAFREVHHLTDAERTTEMYSNRFAGHVLPQTAAEAWCKNHGWEWEVLREGNHYYTTSTGSTTRFLPHYHIEARWWQEGMGNDEAFRTAQGEYLFAATDQVRFRRRHKWHSVPLALADVPPVAFSEIMRELNQCTAVCSAGINPAWRDRGGANSPQRERTLWENEAWGDLSVSAEARAQSLVQLLPGLHIAPRCEINGAFLRVRGDVRTYKIHLGSGNILMEPNDQYLCIVPDQRPETRKADAKLFLPFEGDSRLSLVLSKAFLLTHDAQITDPVIVRQLKG